MPSSTRTKSRSPSPTPNEVTTLLPPSRARTPPTASSHGSHAHPHGHNRKVSVSARSVAGSVRGYGAVRPSPAEQAPRVSKVGQRRILTTIPLQIAFLTLVALTFLSLVLTLILFLNTAMDLSGILLPYRGSGFLEFWLSAVGSWIGLGGVIFFSHPSSLFFLTSLLTLVLHIPILLLILLNPHLSRLHAPLFLIPFILTALTVVLTLLSNHLVRRARWKEGQRISRMLTDAAARERQGDDAVARAAVGMQKGWGGRVVGFFFSVVELIAGLAAVILVSLLLIDVGITAYDSSVSLPSPSSKVVGVHPTSSPWSIRVHLACVSPPNTTTLAHLPTILYEPRSGVPGSLALYDYPMPPSPEGSENPGRWIFEMQERGEVGKVCVWDRPGYGFSEVLGDADLGGIAGSLYEGLQLVVVAQE